MRGPSDETRARGEALMSFELRANARQRNFDLEGNSLLDWLIGILD